MAHFISSKQKILDFPKYNLKSYHHKNSLSILVFSMIFINLLII